MGILHRRALQGGVMALFAFCVLTCLASCGTSESSPSADTLSPSDTSKAADTEVAADTGAGLPDVGDTTALDTTPGDAAACTALCDDSEPCTEDGCLPDGGCEHSPLPDGTACPGGVCQAGVCVSASGACTTVQDLVAVRDPARDLTATATACALGPCRDPLDEDCLRICVALGDTEAGIEGVGLSPDCAGCFGRHAHCSLSHCLVECQDEPDGTACRECLAADCTPALCECAGAHFVDGCTETLPGPCGGPEDREILAALNSAPLATGLACGATCIYERTLSCYSNCIAEGGHDNQDEPFPGTGLSPGCSMCQAALTLCVLDHCMTYECAWEMGEECLACAESECLGEFCVCMGYLYGSRFGVCPVEPDSYPCSRDEPFCLPGGHLGTCGPDGRGPVTTTYCQYGCDSASPACYPTCAPGELYCSDETTRSVCNDSGTGPSESVDCTTFIPNGIMCFPGTRDCAKCVPGEWSCAPDGVTATKCNESGTGAATVVSCQNVLRSACDPETGRCLPCPPDGWYCPRETPGVSALCDSEGQGPVQTVNCGDVTNSECRSESGRCGCAPGERYCLTRASSAVCNEDGNGPVDGGMVESCGIGCDPDTGNCH